MGRKLDLTNMRFGRLTALKSARRSNGELGWLCQCDCGKTAIVPTNNLTKPNKPTISCGCYHSERLKEQNRKYAKASGESAFRSLISAYRRDAAKAGRVFDLSDDEFRILTKGNCYYCGLEPSNFRKSSQQNGHYVYNGVDRVDSNLGYFVENCVPCCKRCNQAKNDMTMNEFTNWLERAYNWTIKNSGENR